MSKKSLVRMASISIASLALATAGSAHAASFIFDVNYDGTTASLAAGSDDPLATTLAVGDTFTYSLNATGGQGWTTLADGSIFPFFSLQIAESGTRTIDYTLNLNRMGVSVFSDADPAAENSFVHLGTNTVSFTAGLEFDQWVLVGEILASDAMTTPNSLLPFNAAPEDYSPDLISFGALGAVPEPATWAFMIVGFGAVGGALRSGRRRKTRVNVSYA